MSKIRTSDDLSNAFDRDLIWRRNELSDLKRSIEKADISAKGGLSRALLLMAYAHWEGFVKNCARSYFDFLTIRNRPYIEYEKQIYASRCISELHSFFASKAGFEKKRQFIQKVISGENDRFSNSKEIMIDTKSNLNSNVILEICEIININSDYFSSKILFIDVKLLKRRNSIAHGNYEFTEVNDFQEILDGVLEMMAEFRNLLENKVISKSYLR